MKIKDAINVTLVTFMTSVSSYAAKPIVPSDCISHSKDNWNCTKEYSDKFVRYSHKNSYGAKVCRIEVYNKVEKHENYSLSDYSCNENVDNCSADMRSKLSAGLRKNNYSINYFNKTINPLFKKLKKEVNKKQKWRKKK